MPVGQPTFAGRTIFGFNCRQSGPDFAYRSQREQLPGVDGFRVYRLGKDLRKWTVRGRLTALSLPLIQRAVATAQGFNNGGLYTFTDNAAIGWPNCLLSSYGPIGNYEPIRLSSGLPAFTVEVQGTVEQATP